MSLSRVFSTNPQISKFSSSKEPLVVRMFGEEILEIFLDKTAFLFGILSNPEKRTLGKRITFLPLQPVLPEQIGSLQKLLSPEMSFLRLKDSNVIQIEPKMLGGGIQTEIDPEVKAARELFLKLSALTKETIAEINQREIFDKITSLSKALPSLSNYKDRLADAWYVAKVLHMAVDVLLLTIWRKEKDESQDARYSFEQKKAILKPIRNAKKILENHTFPLKEASLLSLDLAETGVQLLPESDMKAKDWKAFICIGEAVNSSFIATDSSESDKSQQVSKLLTDLWFSLGGHWTVSPNLYRDSILARFLPLNENFQISHLTDFLKCSFFKVSFIHTEPEENADTASRHLLAFDRLTNLSLYELQEGLREEAFYAIYPWTLSKNETLRKSAIFSLTQISLLSKDTLIRKKALEVLDKLSLNQEESYFLFSYQNWVVDNLPRGYLDEENLKIEQAFEMARDQRSLDIIKRLSFCAADESLPPILLEDEFVPFRSTFQEIVDLGLIEANNGTYKISKKTQARLKSLIPKREESDEKALFGLAKSLNKAWNFDETNLDNLIDQQGNIPLHIQSFVENILKEDKTSDQLVIASIVFLNKLGLYHLFVKENLYEALDSFKKAIDRFAFLGPKAKKTALLGFGLPKEQDIRFLFNICCSMDRSETELDLLAQKLDLRDVRFLSALIKMFSSISSLKINGLSCESIEPLALGIKSSKLLNLHLQFSEITGEGAKALAAALPTSQLTNLHLQWNKIGAEGAKAFAAALPASQLTNLDLQGNKIGAEGAKALAAALPTSQVTSLSLDNNNIRAEGVQALLAALLTSQVTNLYLQSNKIGAEGAKALAAALPASQVTKLNLQGNNIGAEGAQALAAALPTSQVTSLNLHNNNIRAEGVQALAAALPASQVTNLNLHNNNIRAEGVQALAAALPASQVTNLHLQLNYIGAEGAQALAAALPASQLTNLDLQGNNIGDEGAQALAAALPASQVTSLNLQNNNIGAEGAQALAAALPASQLTSLNLHINDIGDEGAKALAAALPTSQLTNLDLQWNNIGDEGAKALAAVLPTSQLTKLNLYGNIIGDEGAQALAAALPTSQLVNLGLSGNLNA